MRSLPLAVAALCGLGPGCSDEPRYTRVDSYDDCRVGLYFAECGDHTGEPVLGCESPVTGGRCRWFTTGAVPLEVEVISNCPADDICCVDNWPFADAVGLDASRLFYALDEQPWDRHRAMDVDVVIDESLTAPPTPTLTCTGPLIEESGVGPCDNVEGVVAYDLDIPAIAIYAPGNYYGWNPIVEIDGSNEGGLRARVCIHRYTDSRGNSCEPNSAMCATSGAVGIDRWPLPTTAGSPFHLDVVFADGSTLVADSVVTTVLTPATPGP